MQKPQGESKVEFLRDPFKFARDLLEEKKSGKLQITQQELEVSIKSQLRDSQKESSIGSPGYIPQPPKPTSQFNTAPPKCFHWLHGTLGYNLGSNPDSQEG